MLLELPVFVALIENICDEILRLHTELSNDASLDGFKFD